MKWIALIGIMLAAMSAGPASGELRDPMSGDTCTITGAPLFYIHDLLNAGRLARRIEAAKARGASNEELLSIISQEGGGYLYAGVRIRILLVGRRATQFIRADGSSSGVIIGAAPAMDCE